MEKQNSRRSEREMDQHQKKLTCDASSIEHEAVKNQASDKLKVHCLFDATTKCFIKKSHKRY